MDGLISNRLELRGLDDEQCAPIFRNHQAVLVIIIIVNIIIVVVIIIIITGTMIA